MTKECWECLVKTNAESLVLSSRLYMDPELQISFKKYGAQSTTYGFYYLVWICPSCNTPNIHNMNEIEPLSIVPKHGITIPNKFVKNNKNTIKLISEFLKCKSIGAYSACIMLGRKILMHIALEESDININGSVKENQGFVYYVDEIVKSAVLGKKWKAKLDKLRLLGNGEAHDNKVGTVTEANIVTEIIIGLIYNLYDSN